MIRISVDDDDGIRISDLRVPTIEVKQMYAWMSITWKMYLTGKKNKFHSENGVTGDDDGDGIPDHLDDDDDNDGIPDDQDNDDDGDGIPDIDEGASCKKMF